MATKHPTIPGVEVTTTRGVFYSDQIKRVLSDGSATVTVWSNERKIRTNSVFLVEEAGSVAAMVLDQAAWLEAQKGAGE